MKRVIDFFLALLLLLLALPLLLLVAILVKINLGSPVLFQQVRPGLHGKPFRMYKFRSMLDSKGKNGELLADEHRLTAFGRFLRKTSLDELPEILNILKGEMSFVGPRPLLMEYLPLYSKRQFRRHEVLPGITGWAQVNGRNALGWPERFEMDVWYVENQNLWLDLKILLRTFFTVFSATDISQDGHATMSKFTGNDK